MIRTGSERGPVALPVFKIGRCLLEGQAGFDSQALPPEPTIAGQFKVESEKFQVWFEL